LWLTEFYGESEWGMAKMALQKATNYQTVAYLDPFDHVRTQAQKPDLVLKPDSLEQAIAMSLEMLKMPVINLLIIDSLFLLPSTQISFEESLLKLVKGAERAQKPIYLLNPDNRSRKLLEKNLKSFCNSQIWIH
jgi:hypothetical protein